MKGTGDNPLSVLQPISLSTRIYFWPTAFGLWPHMPASASRGKAADCLKRKH
jgi:hypothetical protein